MTDKESSSSYSFYVPDRIIEEIDNSEKYSRSEAARQALNDWASENLEGI